MKSYIFKLAHTITKGALQDGDDYHVTFGAALKSLYKIVKRTTKAVKFAFDNGFTKFTTDSRRWNIDGKQVGGYCLLASNGTHEYNITQILHGKKTRGPYYFTYDGQPKSLYANIALFVIRDLKA